MFCENFLSLIDCLITPKREGRVMRDLDVETFPLTVSEILERAEDGSELILTVVSENHGCWGQRGAIRTILH